MACTDDAKVRAKAIAINLSIASLSCLLSANARRFLLLAKPTGAAHEAPVIDLDQARLKGRSAPHASGGCSLS
jgi:hypothetical protein